MPSHSKKSQPSRLELVSALIEDRASHAKN